jgi:rSAM/selenodomain-associated transferase 2
MRHTLIIPVLNEASQIQLHLAALRALPEFEADVMVVDGGSSDDTVKLAQPLADHVIVSETGRARQMNAGAKLARGEYLVFLHADTRLPNDVARQLQQASDQGALWGRFDVRISGKPWMLAVVSRLMNLRSRITGIATGDQVIFIKRNLFESIGGYTEQPLMEDIDICQRLRSLARPYCLKGPVITSGRRWEKHGVWRTIILMWRLRWRYWRGERAETLAREYL